MNSNYGTIKDAFLHMENYIDAHNGSNYFSIPEELYDIVAMYQ